MQSHKVYSTVMCISLIVIFSGVVAATPPEGSTHGVSEGSTHDMPMGGDRERCHLRLLFACLLNNDR